MMTSIPVTISGLGATIDNVENKLHPPSGITHCTAKVGPISFHYLEVASFFFTNSICAYVFSLRVSPTPQLHILPPPC